MNNLPQWLITAIISVSVAGITWLASRRLNRASAGEKEANTSKILQEVSANLARQLRAVEIEVPGWKKKIAQAELAQTELAEQINKAKLIQTEAKIIVDAMDHMEYVNDPSIPETKFAKYFKRAKDAALRIAAVEI